VRRCPSRKGAGQNWSKNQARRKNNTSSNKDGQAEGKEKKKPRLETCGVVTKKGRNVEKKKRGTGKGGHKSSN